jgi:hypothetical protein
MSNNSAAAAAATTTTSAAAAATPEVVFGLEDLRPRSRVARSATYRILCNGLDVKCAGKHDMAAATTAETRENAVLAATSESRHGIVTCVTIQVNIIIINISFFFFSFIYYDARERELCNNNNPTDGVLFFNRLDRRKHRHRLAMRRPVYDVPNC